MPRHRPPWTPQKVRERIQVSQLINRLHACAMGTVELTKSQVTAIQVLLRKALPDLSAVEHRGFIEHRKAEELSDAELAEIAIAGEKVERSSAAGSEEVH